MHNQGDLLKHQINMHAQVELYANVTGNPPRKNAPPWYTHVLPSARQGGSTTHLAREGVARLSTLRNIPEMFALQTKFQQEHKKKSSPTFKISQ